MATPSTRSSTPSDPVTGEPSSSAPHAATPTSGGTNAQSNRTRVPTNVPFIYGDQIMDVVYGIYTTKIVFGIESGSGVQPVGVAVVPTMALFPAVTAIKESLTAPALIEEMTTRISGALQTMRGQPKSKNTETPAGEKG